MPDIKVKDEEGMPPSSVVHRNYILEHPLSHFLLNPHRSWPSFHYSVGGCLKEDVTSFYVAFLDTKI
jgi:hypothetical protein